MTDALKKALALAEIGFYVFPTLTEDITLTLSNGEEKEYGVKMPDPRLARRGVLDATRDPGIIEDWWRDQPTSYPGVATGLSGLNVLDIDRKGDIDGQENLDKKWLDVPDTFSYDTPNNGIHRIYLAPSNVNLNGQSKYRKIEGIDRRAGNSYVVWYGPVPNPEDIHPAPEWLCDPATARSAAEFEGDVQKWYEHLTPGEPNALVRRALNRIPVDMSHSEMVEHQFEAIRLGAEGNPGVVQLLDAIEEAWLSRPAGNHETPENEWEFKFHEALASGVQKYGAQTDTVTSLYDYSLAIVPTSVPESLVSGTGGPLDSGQWSRLLGLLVEATDDDVLVATILWFAPKPSPLSREWGLEFVRNKRIPEARSTPEPVRENPALEEKREREMALSEPQMLGEEGYALLTPEERAIVASCPTFVDSYLFQGQQGGFANPVYFRSSAWTIASLVFAFRGFIPVTTTDKMGLNLWNLTLGDSGTGKSRAIKFRDAVLKAYFGMEDSEQPYNLGADSSPEGILLGLLQRDRKASFFGQDEGSGFFKKLAQKDWMSGLDDSLSRWYEGWVDPSSKISLKELRGKSALTSFHIQFYATPDRLTDILTREMFLSGFLARMSWSVGDPPIETDARFTLLQQDEVAEGFDEIAEPIRELVADLHHAASLFPEPTPILGTKKANARMGAAYKRMHTIAKQGENWDIIEPSITRLAETMRKCAAITAMYRGSAKIELSDALVAINAVEEWFSNLFAVADMVSSGEFQRSVKAIMQWIRNKGGRATKAQVFHQFRNMVVKDGRELESKLQFLLESGSLVREEVAGGGTAFRVNGG